MLYSSGQAATSQALPRLHIQLFFLNKKFEGGVVRGSPGENNVRETAGRKDNCDVNFFSMHFVRTKETFVFYKQ